MTLKTWTIELRADLPPAKQELILTSMRMAAKHVFTTALLLAEKRKPLIALSTSDMIEGAEEISLADDMPVDEEPAEEPTEGETA
jgi:hypothetical protein